MSTLVTTWPSNVAFHLLLIWLQPLVEIDSESCQTSFQSFCAPPSEVAVLFDSNLSRRPFLGQVAFVIYFAANFGCDRFRSRQTSFQSFCSPPSEVAVLFNSNLSRPLDTLSLDRSESHLRPILLQLWLKSIQNHARHRFQGFARRHLKLLCCSIRI